MNSNNHKQTLSQAISNVSCVNGRTDTKSYDLAISQFYMNDATITSLTSAYT